MRKSQKLLSLLLSAVMLLGMIPLVELPIAFADTWGGSFTNSSGYSVSGSTVTISSANGFAYFIQQVCSGNNHSGKTVNLTTDINLNGTNWNPSGTGSFSGTFDGGNHTVSGLYISTSDTDRGLFRKAENATIKNLKISSPNINVTICSAGPLIGWTNAGTVTVTNCHVTGGTVTCPLYTGGLIGASDAINKISNCSSSATVSALSY